VLPCGGPDAFAIGYVQGDDAEHIPRRPCGNTGGWKMAVKLGPLSPFPAKNPL
jgi:hypothetical protein